MVTTLELMSRYVLRVSRMMKPIVSDSSEIIVHSDHLSTYATSDYQKLLKQTTCYAV